MEAFQVLDALLDVLDATGTVVGLMTLWYTWVMPPRIAPERVAAMEIEDFLRAVAAAPARSSQAAGDIPKVSGWAAVAPAQPPKVPLSAPDSPPSCHPAA
jgi:hypothetical protein